MAGFAENRAGTGVIDSLREQLYTLQAHTHDSKKRASINQLIQELEQLDGQGDEAEKLAEIRDALEGLKDIKLPAVQLSITPVRSTPKDK